MIDKDKIPGGWEIARLGEVCEILDGQRKPINSEERLRRIDNKNISKLFPYFGATGQVGWIDDYLSDGKYVLLGEDGAPFLEPFKSKAYIVKGKIWVNNHAHILNPYLVTEFLCFYLNQVSYRQYVTGTTRLKLNQSSMKEIPVVVPPYGEQKRIVAKIEELFSELDKGIESLKTAQQQLKIYRQSVLKQAFEGKYISGDVSERKWYALKDICNIKGGVTKGRDLSGKDTITLPYLRVANVQDGYLDLNEIKSIMVLPDDRLKYELKYGDILYTEGGDKDKLGRGTVWKNEIKNCIHQNHIFRARPDNDDIDSRYIAYFSQTKFAKDYFFRNGKQTTNLASINMTILSNLSILMYPIKEQTQIVQEIESRFSVCDKVEETINESLKQAAALRQSILKKAFEGRLVPQDPSDEPASVLLARIRAERQDNKPAKKLSPGTKRKI